MKKAKAEHFPRFSEFVRGYLHQDLLPEHGTPAKAAAAYLKDLSAKERAEVAAEVGRMRTAAQHWDLAEINRRLHAMGSAWTAPSAEEFDRVLAALTQ